MNDVGLPVPAAEAPAELLTPHSELLAATPTGQQTLALGSEVVVFLLQTGHPTCVHYHWITILTHREYAMLTRLCEKEDPPSLAIRLLTREYVRVYGHESPVLSSAEDEIPTRPDNKRPRR